MVCVAFKLGLISPLILSIATLAQTTVTCNERQRSDKYCAVSEAQRSNWREAQERCKETSNDLGLPQDQSDVEHRSLLKMMTKLDLETLWISLRKKKLENWTWTNGAEVHEPPGGSRDGRCGVYAFNINELDVDKTYCISTLPSKYVCQHKGPTCPPVVPRYKCSVVNGNAVTLHGGVYDWFTARELCRAAGANLLSFDKGFGKEYVKFMKSEELIFVGLHNEDWFFVQPDGGEAAMKTVFWGKHAVNSHKCAVLNRSSELWTPSHCDGRHPYICQIYDRAHRLHTKSKEYQRFPGLKEPAYDRTYLTNLYLWMPATGILHVVTIGVICTCSALIRQKVSEFKRNIGFRVKM